MSNQLKNECFWPDLEPANDGLEWAKVLEHPELLSDVDPFGDDFCSMVSWLVIVPVRRARHQHSGYHTKGNGVELKKIQANLNYKLYLSIVANLRELQDLRERKNFQKMHCVDANQFEKQAIGKRH